MLLTVYIIKHIMSKQDVFLAIQNFNELQKLANNAKIRSLLIFFTYMVIPTCIYYSEVTIKSYSLLNFFVSRPFSFSISSNSGMCLKWLFLQSPIPLDCCLSGELCCVFKVWTKSARTRPVSSTCTSRSCLMMWVL